MDVVRLVEEVKEVGVTITNDDVFMNTKFSGKRDKTLLPDIQFWPENSPFPQILPLVKSE